MMADTPTNSTSTVLILFFVLVLLVILLVYLYKRLNHETKDQYSIHRFVFREGGLRDRVMHGVAVMEARLVQIRPRAQVDEEVLNSNDDLAKDKEEGEEDAEECHSENEKTEGNDHHDSSDDYSSIDLQERVKQNNSKEEEKKEKEPEEEKAAKDEANEDHSKPDDDDDGDVKNEERVGLLVDLKTFSSSAIWSEEKKEESNVTAL